MHRPLVAALLAALIAVTGAGLVAAGEPVPGTSGSPQAVEPAPSVEPTAPPEPSSTPGIDPTADPTAEAPSDAPASTDDQASTDDPAPSADDDPAQTDDPAASGDLPDGAPNPAGRFIVILDQDVDPGTLIKRHGQRNGVRATASYDTAFRGYAASLSPSQRRGLLSDPNVSAIVPDELIELTAQTVPTGVSRVGARQSAVAAINGTDQRVDADIAIVDTGIALHPDLNVVGGVNCTTSDRSNWHDWNGHGTHVAGTVAALDNDIGVVGVAPGARLWAVRILNSQGSGLLSWYICGLDWILAQRDPNDASRPLIEGVNMSVAKRGSDDVNCGYSNADVLHQAICRVVAGGITVVAAAANASTSAAAYVPAAYNEVITVSALADSDGLPGGHGGNRCYSWGTYDKDDTFADFSNYGSDVDLIAPGKCIWSTVPGGYGYSSGTSMAAPAVAGAVALYKASRPMATPADVREALRYLGNLGWDTSTDPDPYHEPLLDVSRIGSLGTFRPEVMAPAPIVTEKGASFSLPVAIHHSATFFERVRMTLGNVPSGWTVSYTSAWLYGWSATATTIRVTVPVSTKPGVYTIRLIGTNYGRVREATLPVTVEGDAPTAKAPSMAGTTGVAVTGTSSLALTTRVSWAAATDPTSAIGGYELQRSTNGVTWLPVASTTASVRSVAVRSLAFGVDHRFRLRARDTLGNWSPWVQSPSTYRLTAVSDRSTAITYRGTWSRMTSSPATDRSITSSTRAGASARYQFTGRGIVVFAPTSTTRGRMTVLIDGVNVGTVDLRSSRTLHRRVVFTRTFATSGTHTIELRVQGTSGRPLVSLDGFVVVR
ncbi:MAG: S8 family serine peptidase [Candidatus Limnocylindrales bacterium]